MSASKVYRILLVAAVLAGLVRATQAQQPGYTLSDAQASAEFFPGGSGDDKSAVMADSAGY